MPTSSFKEQKQRKLDLQIGINKSEPQRLRILGDFGLYAWSDVRFNMKPKRGIEYLKKNGFACNSVSKGPHSSWPALSPVAS